jgi:hypothetical protein
MVTRLLLKSPKKCMFLAIWAQLAFFANSAQAANEAVTTFTTPISRPRHESNQVDYAIDPRTARYFIHVPSSYSRSVPFGLIVYISAFAEFKALPEGWEGVLDRRRLLFVCPQDAGNESKSEEEREGRAVLGALEMMRNYNVDASRVYVSGFSGGARSASHLGLVQSDIFRGAILNCGVDFHRDVPTRYATTDKDQFGNHYGVCAVTPNEIASARDSVKFALITGSGDFRRGNILDIYYGGYLAERFRCKLFDVSGMGHQNCDSKTLEESLDFLK